MRDKRISRKNGRNIQVHNPDIESGFENINFPDWLNLMLERAGLKPRDLYDRFKASGNYEFEPNVPGMWASEKYSLLPKHEHVPELLGHLEIPRNQQPEWLWELSFALYIHESLRGPMEESAPAARRARRGSFFKDIKAKVERSRRSDAAEDAKIAGIRHIDRDKSDWRLYRRQRGGFKGQYKFSSDRYDTDEKSKGATTYAGCQQLVIEERLGARMFNPRTGQRNWVPAHLICF